MRSAAKQEDNRVRPSSAKVVEISKQQNDFPIEVLPEPIQKVINEWFKAYGLPKEYFCSGVLSALSAAIGNSIKIKYKNNWYESAAIYSALVGPPSSGKTPALSNALKPIKEIEKQYWEDHKEAKKEYAQLYHEAKEAKTEKPPEPHNRDLIVQDITQESLTITMGKNPKGLILIMDELIKFIKSMNRYSSGGDLEYYLSIWSNEFVKTNRATKEQVKVPNPFVSIVGGIQTGIIKELANTDNVANGLAARFLFTIPTTFDRQIDNGYNPDKRLIEQYNDLIKSLYGQLEKACGDNQLFENTYTIESRVFTGVIEMNNEAFDIYKEYRNEKILAANQATNGWERGSLGKFETYCLRFALILQLIDAVSNGREIHKVGSIDEPQAINEKVTGETLKKAIKLCDYFEKTMLSMVDRVGAKVEETTILDLPEKTRLIYESLPNEFSFSEGEIIAKKVQASRRTYTRLLKREDLVNKNERTGIYNKLILIKHGTNDTMTPNEYKALNYSNL